MPIVTSHEPGTFCWPELFTTDPAGSKLFYVRLFGWEVRDIPMGPHAVYTIFTLGGDDAAACYGALPDMAQQGIRPHGVAYVWVVSSDETAATAKAGAGGMTPITPEMGPIKPAWVSYFRVTDCDAAVQKCAKLGGSIAVPAESVPSVGRFAVLEDPAGARFGIMQPA